MSLVYIAAFFAAAFMALDAIDRRHAAHETERRTALRRLRAWRPSPAGYAVASEPRHPTSCPVHPMPGRDCVPHPRNPRSCLWCGRELPPPQPQDGAA
jgi:hypothetical protein